MRKIALPIICALIVVVGSIGIVLGSTLINRTIHVTIADQIQVSPTGDSTITVYKGSTTQIPYDVYNASPDACNVTVSWDTPLPSGISVDSNLISFTLGAGLHQTVTISVTANDAAANCDLTIHFTCG